MKPLAPVTRQTSSRDGSTGLPRNGAADPLAGAASIAPAPERRGGDVAHDRPVLARGRRGTRRARRRARRGSCAPRLSESVSGGSSLITSFLPAAIVITPWSRCSGITISCGKSPSLAMWIRRQLSRATRERGAPQLDPDHQPAAADLLDHLVALLRARRARRAARSLICAACATQAVALDDAHRRQTGRHRQAVAAERRLVDVAALERSDGPLVDLPAS